MQVRALQTVSDKIQDINNKSIYKDLTNLNKRIRTDTSDPTANNDWKDGVEVGTLWVNTGTGTAFVNLDNTAGAAVWLNLNTGGGSMALPVASVLEYDEAPAVPSTTLTTVATLAPVADTNVTKIICSGMEYGKFQLFLNSVLKATKRGGPDRSVEFDFVNPLVVPNGDTLDVKVTHFVSGETPTFEASIIGYV